MTFGALQSVVGFGNAGPNTTTLSAFDASHNLLYTNTFSSAINDYWVLTDNTGANISSIEIASSFIAIDDVQFNNNSVPEPSSLFSLAGMAGFLGLGLRRRFASR